MGELTELVHTMFKAIDASDFETIESAFSEDVDFKAPGAEGRGATLATGFMRPFLAAFPDIHHEVSNVVESDGSVACEVLITGTHTEPLAGPDGDLPPTGNQLSLPAANLWKVGPDGKITSYHSYFDMMTFMGQLGMGAPPPS